MRLLNHSEIWSVYSMPQAIADIAAAFAFTSSQNPLLPLRTRLNLDPRRTVLVMPAAVGGAGHTSSNTSGSEGTAPPSKASPAENPSWAVGNLNTPGGVAVKTISLYPDNAPAGLPTAPASLLLLDAETGIAKALLDGDTVTKIRTGASSGVALKYLADPDTEIGVVVGTGGQAATQALAMACALPQLKELRIVNRQLDKAQHFIEFLSNWPAFKQSPCQAQLRAFSDADQAAVGAKAIILVTSSHTPVLGADNLEPGCVISCVGSYQPHMQECGSDIIARANLIVCDQVEAAVAESGDLIIPLQAGIISSADLQTEIGQVITGAAPGRRQAGDIIVYETVGLGTQDLWAAQAIVSAAEAKQVGTLWDPFK